MKYFGILLLAGAVVLGYGFRGQLAQNAPSWLLSYLGANLAPARAADAAAPPPGAVRRGGGAVAVETALTRTGQLPIQRATLGTIVPVRSTMVASQIAGTVAQILVHDGAEVKKGQVLIRLDARQIDAQIAKDRAQIAKDEASVASALSNEQRTAHLQATGVATVQSGEDARTALQVARGTLAVDHAVLAADQVQRSMTEIAAPFDGRLGAVQPSIGAFVAPGAGLVRVTEMKQLQVQFTLAETELPLLRRAMAAGDLEAEISPITPGGGGSTPQKAKVVFIDNAVAADSGTVTLRATLANDQRVFWPGQMVDVVVTAGYSQPLILVPDVAITLMGGQSVVYVVDAGNKVAPRPVTVAMRQGDTAGLSAGVKPGERVVTVGQAMLHPGSEVAIKQPPGQTGAAHASAPRRKS